MTDNINFSGSIERFLKGDADPINLFGLSPSRAELRANESDRARRSSQMAFEQGSEGLRKGGGSIDPATKQVRKLKESKTAFAGLTPLTPVPLPSATITNVAIEAGAGKSKSKKDKKALAAANKRHADTALIFRPQSSQQKRLSAARIRRSILN